MQSKRRLLLASLGGGVLLLLLVRVEAGGLSCCWCTLSLWWQYCAR